MASLQVAGLESTLAGLGSTRAAAERTGTMVHRGLHGCLKLRVLHFWLDMLESLGHLIGQGTGEGTGEGTG